MPTVTEFVVQLVRSIVELVVIFVTEVAAHGPITLLIFLAGAALTTFAAGFFAVLVLGAAADGVREAVAP
ncbi:hypothetical protein ACOZ4L_08105 [Haloplanus ruber]|uniref:Major facilitator superfamily (MFS) profile domain-containing protein n=1 Tax=Haloplanus ruber TaxID=869892 RepID=A0ABD6CWR3_9EURY|nr:hypothetical protein [Haloplanus ruber]